jgi:hypothetical protein
LVKKGSSAIVVSKKRSDIMEKNKLELPVKDIYEDRIPISKCKKILNNDGHAYTDEETLLIRDFLYSLAIVDYYVNEQRIKKEAELNELKTIDYDEPKESNTIFPSEYRRAS